MRELKTIIGIIILSALLSTGTSSVTFAASQPDLIVKSISGFPVSPASMNSSGSFTITTKIKNIGKKKALDKFTTQYYLSSDNSYSSNDILLEGSRAMPALKPKKISTGKSILTVPSTTPTGNYYLIACVDRMNNIAESNETNNCTASKTTIGVNNNSSQVIMPASSDVQNIPVSTGLNVFTFTYTLPGTADNYDSISVDLQDILSNSVTITPMLTGNNIMKFLAFFTSTAEALTPAYMTARIGSDINTVCTQGLVYGPYIYSGNGSVYPSTTASATPSSVNIIKSGAFAICLQVTSPIDATVTVGDVPVNVTPCDQAPKKINGKWKGTYTCINNGWKNEVNLPVSLTITQDGKLHTLMARLHIKELFVAMFLSLTAECQAHIKKTAHLF